MLGIKIRRDKILWGLVILFCLSGVFGRSLWGPLETRGAGMIWDMYRHGMWVFPTLNGFPYLEKPPLLHWTALVCCSLAGGVNEALVRIPSALYAFGTLLLIFLFIKGQSGREGGDRNDAAAWAAVFCCATRALKIWRA